MEKERERVSVPGSLWECAFSIATRFPYRKDRKPGKQLLSQAGPFCIIYIYAYTHMHGHGHISIYNIMCLCTLAYFSSFNLFILSVLYSHDMSTVSTGSP